MTDRTPKPGRGAVYWLTAQSVLFGLVAALLGVVANAMFLDAYGAEWLPVTYIVIGAAGALVSALIARMAQSYNLVRIAVVVLTSVAVVFLAAWVVAGDGGAAWVSAPLLVMFPILIQLGFVFIGAQAGRILDIAGIKARFPRVMAGFPVGAIVGGLVAAPLVGILGRTEGLLLVTALAQAAFAALVLVTGIRYAAFLAVDPTAPTPPVGGPDEDADAAPGIRQLLATRFVGLILGYQVLSALASQLSEYLVLDRAAAQFEGAADLARFIAGYTAVMNVVSLVFLAVVAGPLMRRFGLRLGIAINPVVLTVCAVGMLAVLAVTGSASVALLVMVSTARILDIALTDGTTRTSINAMYQVLPARTRLSAQATIEGMGVPVAIAVSGVLVIVLNALPWSLPALIVTTTVVSAVWVWVGVLLYRTYGPALVDALRQHRLLVPTTQVEGTGDDLLAAGSCSRAPTPGPRGWVSSSCRRWRLRRSSRSSRCSPATPGWRCASRPSRRWRPRGTRPPRPGSRRRCGRPPSTTTPPSGCGPPTPHACSTSRTGCGSSSGCSPTRPPRSGPPPSTPSRRATTRSCRPSSAPSTTR